MDTQTFNHQKAEEFANTMLDIINGGALALMISIGHRTGLFDTLGELPPSTSEQIAEAANLKERYVREWLGALVTGRIIEYDPTNGTYHLPAEHAAWLTRSASPNNMAVTAQFVSMLGSVEGKVIESFQRGGGVPYVDFPRFHEVMAEESSQTVGTALLDSILPLAPGLVNSLREGIEVLDVGCGRGHALNLMAQAFPMSRFTGYDFSDDGISAAREEAKRLGLTNVNFAVKDVSELSERGRYDLITAFDSIHDQAKPDHVLQGIADSLRPDGTFLMQDIRSSSHLHKNADHPLGPFLYTISCMHCMTVSLALDGKGLGTVWGEERALQMLDEAGFKNIEIRQLPHDIMNSYFIARKK